MSARHAIVVEQPDGLTNTERAALLERLHLRPGYYDLLIRLVEGKVLKQIAYEMGLSEGSVKTYLHELRKDKCMENNIKLAVWFVRQTWPQRPTA